MSVISEEMVYVQTKTIKGRYFPSITCIRSGVGFPAGFPSQDWQYPSAAVCSEPGQCIFCLGATGKPSFSNNLYRILKLNPLWCPSSSWKIVCGCVCPVEPGLWDSVVWQNQQCHSEQWCPCDTWLRLNEFWPFLSSLVNITNVLCIEKLRAEITPCCSGHSWRSTEELQCLCNKCGLAMLLLPLVGSSASVLTCCWIIVCGILHQGGVWHQCCWKLKFLRLF